MEDTRPFITNPFLYGQREGKAQQHGFYQIRHITGQTNHNKQAETYCG
jgi:hypothetical protein